MDVPQQWRLSFPVSIRRIFNLRLQFIHVSVVLVGRYSAARVVLGRISDVQVPVWFASIRV
jgi:hypothetical protein